MLFLYQLLEFQEVLYLTKNYVHFPQGIVDIESLGTNGRSATPLDTEVRFPL